MAFLFGEPKLSKNELRECMEWLDKQYEFSAIQTKEADLHNNALAEYGNSLGTDSDATREMLKAGHRQVQAADGLISRMDNMEAVPEAASLLHVSWRLVMPNFSAYAKAVYAMYKSIEKGMEPLIYQANQLRQELEDSRQKAEKEEKKLLKCMIKSGASMSDFQKLMANAAQAVASENWQPSQD